MITSDTFHDADICFSQIEVQLTIQNNLAVTASVVSDFKEDVCFKTQKTPQFGDAVQKYVKRLIITDNTNVFHSTFPTIPIIYSSQCILIHTRM
jgi:hypothetical protein